MRDCFYVPINQIPTADLQAALDLDGGKDRAPANSTGWQYVFCDSRGGPYKLERYQQADAGDRIGTLEDFRAFVRRVFNHAAPPTPLMAAVSALADLDKHIKDAGILAVFPNFDIGIEREQVWLLSGAFGAVHNFRDIPALVKALRAAADILDTYTPPPKA